MFHELLQGTVSQDRSVMSAIGDRAPCIFRCKRFLRGRFLRHVIADHRGEMNKLPIWRKSICYTAHALKRRGLFEIVETTMNYKQAAKLKVGDRVRFTDVANEGSDACPGTIIEKNWHAVKIQYDDGVVCILHHRDMDEVERLDERYDVTKAVA